VLRCGEYRNLLESDPELEKESAQDALVSMGPVGFSANGAEVLNYEGPFGVGYGVAILYSEGPTS
jgi:hypothetical protein